MKRTIRILSIGLSIVMFLSVLASCGSSTPSMDEVAGVYRATYPDNKDMSVAIVLNEDGTYIRSTAERNVVASTTNGVFEIKEEEIWLYDSDSKSGSYTVYEYSDGDLECGDLEFDKD